MEQYKINLLKLAAKYDIKDTFLWNEELDFSIICSDSFFFATADAEDITSQEDVDLLEQCIKDCLDLDKRLGVVYGPLLYVAKKRKMRPLLDIYPHIPAGICDLLDTCGPERKPRKLFKELKEGIEFLEKNQQYEN